MRSRRAAARAAARVPRNERRVLVVDDNRDAAESLAILLPIDGYTVTVAPDGAGALRALEDFRPEVLLLDIGLPDINGYELARRIRATPTGADCPADRVDGLGSSRGQAARGRGRLRPALH